MIRKLISFYCKIRNINAPEGSLDLFYRGHKKAVGGLWEEIGQLQFDFMLSQGLRPHHVFLDVGCGALRGGIHFIQYLNKSNYLGIDKNKCWVEAGIKNELGRELLDEKNPEFVFSRKFEFNKFSKIPDYAVAQSLFTHLNHSDVELCLKNLRKFVNSNCFFCATFLETDATEQNVKKSHSHRVFQYTKDQMLEFGEKNGWIANYIGEWKHPRNQKMMLYIAR